jgi:opacity protein-like surface antigen
MRKCCFAAFIWVFLSINAPAQGYNFNFGLGPGFPLEKTSDVATTSYNLVVGGGPNLGPHVKANAEFMFQGLPLSQGIVSQIGVSNVKGRLYSLTGNVIAGFSVGDNKTVYIIAGGGWYRRTLKAQQTVLKAGEVCAPVWLWWNVECVNGIFPTDETVGSRSASAGGFNLGGGLAFRLGDSAAHLFTEVRYHRAFTRNIEIVVLPLTFGVRW